MSSAHIQRLAKALRERQKLFHPEVLEPALPADEHDYREIWEFYCHNQNTDPATVDELYQNKVVVVTNTATMDVGTEHREEPLKLFITGFVHSEGKLQVLHGGRIKEWAFDYDNGGLWVKTDQGYWYRLRRPAAFYRLTTWDFFLKVSIWLKVHRSLEELNSVEKRKHRIDLQLLKKKLSHSRSLIDPELATNTMYVGLLAQYATFVTEWMHKEGMTAFKCCHELTITTDTEESRSEKILDEIEEIEEPFPDMNPLLHEEDEILERNPNASGTGSSSPLLTDFYLNLALEKGFPENLQDEPLPYPYSEAFAKPADLVDWFWKGNLPQTPRSEHRLRRRTSLRDNSKLNNDDDAFVPPEEMEYEESSDDDLDPESPLVSKVRRKRKIHDSPAYSDPRELKRRKRNSDDPNHPKYKLGGSLVLSAEEYRSRYSIYDGTPPAPSKVYEFHKIKKPHHTTLVEHMPEDWQEAFKSTKRTPQDDLVLKDFVNWKEEYGEASTREGAPFYNSLKYGHFPQYFQKTVASRKEMKRLGLHNAHMSGIDTCKAGVAASAIVASSGGGYDISAAYQDEGDVMFYVGGGGGTRYNESVARGVGIENQRLDKGPNHCLFNSFIHRIPLRVFRGPKLMSQYRSSKDYRYDGLYAITAVAQDVIDYEVDFNDSKKKGKLPGIIFRFRMIRLDTSTALPRLKGMPAKNRMSRSSFLVGLYNIAQRHTHYMTRRRPKRTSQMSRLTNKHTGNLIANNINFDMDMRLNDEVALARWNALPFSKSDDTKITYIPGLKGFESHASLEVRLVNKDHFLYHEDNENVSGYSHSQTYGVFARDDIPSYTLLGMYTGERITDESIEGSYIFEINHTGELIDAQESGNETRFFNSCGGKNPIKENNVLVFEANVKDFFPEHHKTSQWVIYFVTSRLIKAGEELLLNYGEDYLNELCREGDDNPENGNNLGSDKSEDTMQENGEE